MVEAGEGMAEAAVREVWEECGVRAEAMSLIAMREAHFGSCGNGGAATGSSNLFAAFLLRPLTDDINVDGEEVVAACWMDVDEYIEQASVRMQPGGVYQTINELAVAAFDGRHKGMTGHELLLGSKVGVGSNVVYFGDITS